MSELFKKYLNEIGIAGIIGAIIIATTFVVNMKNDVDQLKSNSFTPEKVRQVVIQTLKDYQTIQNAMAVTN